MHYSYPSSYPGSQESRHHGCAERSVVHPRRYLSYLDGKEAGNILWTKIIESIYHRYGAPCSGAVMDRARNEYEIICRNGMAPSVLVACELVRWAQENVIYLETTWGITTNSVVCHLLGITAIDPLEQHLIFEAISFTEKSASIIEFEIVSLDRFSILWYLRNCYGIEQVDFFSLLNQRSDCARVGPFDAKEAILEAMDFENATQGGVVDKELIRVGTQVFIGLRPLPSRSLLSRVALEVYERLGGRDTFAGQVLEDRETLELLSSDKDGVLLKEAGYRGKALFFAAIHPACFSEVVLALTLCADVPHHHVIASMVAEGKRRIERQAICRVDLQKDHWEHQGKDREEACDGDMEGYDHPVLDSTFGFVLYREQVVLLAQSIAGFSLSESVGLAERIGVDVKTAVGVDTSSISRGGGCFDADGAVSNRWLEKAQKNGYSKGSAERIWGKMVDRERGCLFDRSLVACDAVPLMRLAWLKAHCPDIYEIIIRT